MNDLISKEVVIDTLNAVRDLVWEVDIPSPTVPEYIEHHEQMQSIMRNIDILTDKIIKMPFIQPESAELSGKVWDEWCTDCTEYDQERHCCPRFNRVIRETVDEVKNNQWIPCSERMPENPFGCLVTVWDTNPITMDEFENILPYFVGWDGEQWNDGEGGQCPFEVIAWLPIPEPFKEDRDD